jgi:DNA-directed RNA polymerase subunit RPC12/RpoP
MKNIEDLCEWLKKSKGINKIDLEDLVSYIPEYEKYLEDNDTTWRSDYIECDLCSHKWASVYPEELDRLECPNCNNMVMFEKI